MCHLKIGGMISLPGLRTVRRFKSTSCLKRVLNNIEYINLVCVRLYVSMVWKMNSLEMFP